MDLQEEKELKKMIAYLGRYYADIDTRTPYYQDADVRSLPIWQMWAQGDDTAPPMVKKCFKSVEKYANNRPIGTITLANLSGAGLDLPDYIIEKLERNIISLQHFSDIVRLCLLEKYGGTWIDATVLLTGPIPASILAEPFFAYRSATDNIYSAHTLFSNWFMHAKPNHILVRNLKNALFRYWQAENAPINYFLFHFMAYGMVFSNPTLTKVWFDCSQASNVPPFMFRKSINTLFTPEAVANLKLISTVHKLSSKDVSNVKGSLLNTFLESDAGFDF